MIKVLHVVDCMDICGGIQSFIMNIYKNIDREKIQFDFLLQRTSSNTYEGEIKQLGGKVYYIPGRKEGVLKNKIKLNRFFKTHKEYNIVHYHSSSLSFIEPLVAAKNNGIKTRIMHCHSTNIIKKNKLIYDLLHKYHKKIINKVANVYLACSNDALKFAFGNTEIENKALVVKDGINIKKFARTTDDNATRKEYNIDSDAFVLVHIGRFEKVKNHTFIIDVFEKIREINNKAILVLVGDGPLLNDIKNKIKEKNLQDFVKILGVRKDIDRILKISDSFIFPSFFEGFGISILEAQACGLPCAISNNVPKDVIINDNVIKISLNSSSFEWAKQIINNRKICNSSNLVKKGFDISSTIVTMNNIYNI